MSFLTNPFFLLQTLQTLWTLLPSIFSLTSYPQLPLQYRLPWPPYRYILAHHRTSSPYHDSASPYDASSPSCRGTPAAASPAKASFPTTMTHHTPAMAPTGDHIAAANLPTAVVASYPTTATEAAHPVALADPPATTAFFLAVATSSSTVPPSTTAARPTPGPHHMVTHAKHGIVMPVDRLNLLATSNSISLIPKTSHHVRRVQSSP